MGAIVEVRNVVKRFRIPTVRRNTVREHVLDVFAPRTFETLTVLDSVSFDLEPGATIGIMGRNGGGKSTLLRILSGIYQPDSGRVTARAAITPILELGVGWNPALDALDNICLIGLVMGMSIAEVRRVWRIRWRSRPCARSSCSTRSSPSGTPASEPGASSAIAS
jgi:ABC-2 type transport system ATP-binding protein